MDRPFCVRGSSRRSVIHFMHHVLTYLFKRETLILLKCLFHTSLTIDYHFWIRNWSYIAISLCRCCCCCCCCCSCSCSSCCCGDHFKKSLHTK